MLKNYPAAPDATPQMEHMDKQAGEEQGDLQEQELQRLRTLLREGVKSGAAEHDTPGDWAEMRAIAGESIAAFQARGEAAAKDVERGGKTYSVEEVLAELRAMTDARRCQLYAELLAAALAPLRGRLADAFIFGSVAKGTERSDSDIDVALVGDSDVNLFDVYSLTNEVGRKVGREVHVNWYDREEWESSDDKIIDVIRRGPRIPLLELMDGQNGQPDDA